MKNLRQERKGPNTKPIVWMLVLSWIIIGLGVWWVFFNGNAQQNNDTVPLDDQPVDDIQRWYIGEKVIFDGELTPVEGFGLYTHTFVNEQGKEFGAKSSLVDLFTFEGMVQLKGEITDFRREVPVITVEEIIKASDADIESKAEIDANPNYYYDLDNGLSLDLSISDGYELQEVSGELELIDQQASTNEPVLTIAPFVCKAGDSLQDCSALEQRFIDFGNDTFTNGQGVTFYNLSETNTWFAFNGEKYGFTFRSPNSDMITTFGALVNFIDDDVLDAYVENNKEECKNLSSSMGVVEQIAYQDQGDGVVAATLVGRNNLGNDASCKLLLRLGSTIESVFAGYKADGEEEAAEDEVEEPVAEEESAPEEEEEAVDSEPQEPITPPSGGVERPVSFDGWLQYASIRGFTMWFSKQGVSYVGTVLDSADDLGIEGLTCRYKVNVIAWRQADNVLSTPDLEVYECFGTEVSASEAEAAGLQLVGASGDNQYFAKYYTQNLSPITIYVEEGSAG